MSFSPLRRATASDPPDPPDSEYPLSFESLCRVHGPQIARWAQRLGGPLDQDEIVQEVFLVAARRLQEFRGDAKITTWLFRITTRVIANLRRSARRQHTWGRLTRRIQDQTATDVPGPAAGLERLEANRRFYSALDALPERYREVLVLFELEELSTEEIAKLVESPPATVRVWLHRARAAFVKAWRRDDEVEDKEHHP